MRRLLFAVGVWALLLCPAGYSVLASGSDYTIKDLGTIAGYAPHVTGVNASGSVSGWYRIDAANTRAVRYTDGVGWAAIPGLESVNSFAFGINDNGDVVGYTIQDNGAIRAFRYTDAGGIEYIAPLDGGTFTIGSGINNAGEITGYGNSANGTVAFRQSPHLLAQPIATLGGIFSGGCGINDAGQVAGIAMTDDGLFRGFRASLDGTVDEIPGIGGASSNVDSICGIDANGAATGQSETSSGVPHAFLANGTNVSDLDSFGSPLSNGLAISNGVVVGNYTLPDNVTTHAFMHTTATGTIDLNTLVAPGSLWVLTSATGVNAKGTMAGEGMLDGKFAAWILTAASDTTAPTITSLSVTPSSIKPNNKMASIAVSVTAVDAVDPQPVCSITSIDATEADPGDAAITGALTATVLATKDSHGASRTYAVTVTCGDASANLATGTVDVLIVSGKDSSGNKPVHVTGAAWKGQNKKK
jgi:probable HAF family extracellular repeat protein